VDAAYVINTDAGGGQLVKGKHLRNPVQTSEKVYVTYKLDVVNPGGHSSLPVPDNAIYRLAGGLQRFSRFDFPVRLNETTRAFFQIISRQESGQVAADMLAITRVAPSPRAVARLGASPYYHAMMRNTCVATLLEAGHAENALPQRAEATMQCRLLPGEDLEGVRRTIQRVVADSQIAVTIANEPRPSPASPVNPEIMEPVQRITTAMWPGAVVLPVMDPWSTDGLHFRRAGIPVYGVSAVFVDVDDTRAHGRDERVGVREFYEGVEFMYRLMQALAGTGQASR
jgi:acetylornithine deacetylase/succinyl-diaminopimelate desuccinylase-like protein